MLGELLVAALAAALLASPASSEHKFQHDPGGEQSTTYNVSLVGDPIGVADPIVTGSCLSWADSLHSFVQLSKELDDFCLASPSHPLEGISPGCGPGEVLITYGNIGVRESNDQLDGVIVGFRRGNRDNTLFKAPPHPNGGAVRCRDWLPHRR